MTQLTGELGFNMSTNLFSAFVQDDWQVASSLKLLYGLRYDLYKYPEGLPNAPLTQTHEFNIDRNNIGPRVGVAWQIDSDTVLRASTGIMYDQAILGGYEQALQLSGSPRAPVYTFNPTYGGRTGVPGHDRHRHDRAAVAVGGRSGLPGRAHLAVERADRARLRQRHDGVAERDVCEGRSACRSSPT